MSMSVVLSIIHACLPLPSPKAIMIENLFASMDAMGIDAPGKVTTDMSQTFLVAFAPGSLSHSSFQTKKSDNLLLQSFCLGTVVQRNTDSKHRN